MPKSGSEAYDVSKAAVNHLIRELAVGLGPLVRVNGIAPATVIAGSSMFPRDRVIVALQKYTSPLTRRADRGAQDEAGGVLREAHHYAASDPAAGLRNAICWLAGDGSAKTTGHIIPIDGGLPDAFLR